MDNSRCLLHSYRDADNNLEFVMYENLPDEILVISSACTCVHICEAVVVHLLNK